MEFSGIFFSKSLKSGKEVSNISFGAQKVLLKGENHETNWPTYELQIEIGGSNNHLIFFSHPKYADESFYIEKNKETLQFLEQLNISIWQETLDKNRKQQLTTNSIWMILLGICFGLFYLVFASRGFLAQKVVNSIPYKVEQTIGDKIIGNVLSPGEINGDKNLKNSLIELLTPLFESVPKEFKDFKVHIADKKELNAFALPGGQIVFNLEVLKRANSAEEILGVAAHEMAHVTQRHVLRNMIQALGVFTLFQLFLGDITGVIAVLTDQGTFLLMKGFSRSMEEDADEKGIDYLLKANIDPRGMAGFFKLIKAYYKELGTMGEIAEKMDEHLTLLSTHPSTDSRIKKIEDSYHQLDENKKKQFRKDFPAFNKIKEILKEQ
jgi:Zn-dependent protease with chaperone function